MFLHIGGEYSISDHQIVGIFDFDATTQSGSETIRFLKNAESMDRMEHVSPDIPRSFILTLDRVYISPISAQTLRQRLTRFERSQLMDHAVDIAADRSVE